MRFKKSPAISLIAPGGGSEAPRVRARPLRRRFWTTAAVVGLDAHSTGAGVAAGIFCFGAELFADDFGVRGWRYQADQLWAVEEKINFVVFGSYAQLLDFLAVHYLFAHGIDGDCARGHLLRNEDGESLLAFFVPIVEAG